jgi:hypothetical protein
MRGFVDHLSEVPGKNRPRPMVKQPSTLTLHRRDRDRFAALDARLSRSLAASAIPTNAGTAMLSSRPRLDQ